MSTKYDIQAAESHGYIHLNYYYHVDLTIKIPTNLSRHFQHRDKCCDKSKGKNPHFTMRENPKLSTSAIRNQPNNRGK